MKRLIFTISAFITLLSFSYGQTNTFPTSGNVGIGTTTPVSLLSVGSTSQFQVNSSGAITMATGISTSGQIQENTSAGGTGLRFYDQNSGATVQILAPVNVGAAKGITIDQPNEQILFTMGNIDVGFGGGIKRNNVTTDIFSNYAASGGVTLSTIGTARLTVLTSGNVLIGKTTQTNSGYILDVNGNVRANQVVINTTGADFVFEPTYHLNSLAKVETYIKQNHHLPEIASAKEMQTNGLNVGENQTKLLQKLEELTLYLIEQNKRIEKLESQLKSLKNEK